MREHLEKAKNNERFLEFIEQNIKDNFYDWKIIVIFYAALHYIKALLKLKRKPPGFTHNELKNIINPQNTQARYPFPQKIYDSYDELYDDSRNARYTAVYMNEFQILLMNSLYNRSKTNLANIKKHVSQEGLVIS